ncbi:MAG TPA: dihydrolipoamide acetyltransferase family protein [Solirubrobacteraceae bacterium]|jgi:pyruvate dehydrogenase E2 component (dihydrolipoamide acetyltransferase)
MADIVMPRLSDTMEEGTILRWLRRDGDEVTRGEELVEIETDKATMTYESDQAGVLQTLASEGDTLAVGAVIARVGEPAEVAGQAHAAPQEAGSGQASADAVQAPRQEGPAREATGPTVGATGAAAGTTGVSADGAAARADGGRVKASPLARRIARERGLDLQAIPGSGPGGRIVKADLERGVVAAPEVAAGGATQQPSAAGAPGATQQPPAAGAAGATGPTQPSLEDVTTAKGVTTEVELSRTQQTIARRMAESKATIPDFELLIDVDMEQCVALRSELKRVSEQRRSRAADATGQLEAPTYNDMIVKASALALREHPRANGSYRDGRLQLHSRINVGVAVAAQDSLVVPTVFDADEKSLGEIARETRALAGRVREGTITPPELGGGTFTVSNLGMYGVRSFTAIINPPQAAILSVGSLEARAVVVEGEVSARHTMTLTLACDHRILYGAEAAQFLARVRDLLQTPSALTL